jgi:hypothetical protein
MKLNTKPLQFKCGLDDMGGVWGLADPCKAWEPQPSLQYLCAAILCFFLSNKKTKALLTVLEFRLCIKSILFKLYERQTGKIKKKHQQ